MSYVEFSQQNALHRFMTHKESVERIKSQYLYKGMKNAVRIIMIHEFSIEQCNQLIPLVNPDYDILTWDDGLLSQYKCIKYLKEKLPNVPSLFGVSTDIVNRATEQSHSPDYTPVPWISCREGHVAYKTNNDASAYMTWNHVFDLEKSGAIVMAHGHRHVDFRRKIISVQLKELSEELASCKEVFQKQLGYVPLGYIYPYNYARDLVDPFTKHHGFMVRIGNERMPVETLLEVKPDSQP